MELEMGANEHTDAYRPPPAAMRTGMRLMERTPTARIGSLRHSALRDEYGDFDGRTQLLTDRLIEGLTICMVATLCLMVGEIVFHYSSSRWIPALQFLTAMLLAYLLRVLRRRPERDRVVVIGWIGLGAMCIGTAVIGGFDQEAFGTSSLIIGLAMASATLLPWGGRAQLGAVVPMALSYAYIMMRVTTVTTWGPRLPLGVLVVLVASVYIAHHLERERDAVAAERRRRADENSLLMAELQRANQTKSEFVATMSHELRTPLNVILGYNDLLADGSMGVPTTEQLDALGRIRSNALELLELVNATLDLNRLEAGRVSVNPEVFPLAKLAEEIDAQVRMLCADGVELRWQVPPGLPPVCGDVPKLKVIVKNLTTNALKFTRRGSVTVRLGLLDGDLLLEVADTGIGMTPAAAQVVFEPFQQADASIQRDFGGAGLGLHIVKRLVTTLGGTVGVESELGAGTTMRVRLPQLPRPA